MLLVKLYLLVGCVSRAKALWDKCGVKNAILDSLGSIFFDRISSIAPGFFIYGSSTFRPMDPFYNYFENGLQRALPTMVLEAFKCNNWYSLLRMYVFGENLKRSCTLVMAVIEERRGLRIKTGKNTESLEDNPLVGHLGVEHELFDPTQYSALPGFSGPGANPTEDFVTHGPKPSNERCHLSLLAEHFIDLVSILQPKDFKPSKTGQTLELDHKYAIGRSSKFGRNMDELLTRKHLLTEAEDSYFHIVSLLTKLVSAVLENYAVSADSSTVDSPAPSVSDSRATIKDLVDDITGYLDDETKNLMYMETPYNFKITGFHGFAALHSMGMLRESACVIRLTTGYLTAALEKFKAVATADKKLRPPQIPGGGEAAWVAGQLKTLAGEGAKAETAIAERIAKLRDLVRGGGWIDRLRIWALDESALRPPTAQPAWSANVEFRAAMADGVLEAIGGDVVFEDWASAVVASWDDLLKGWSAVKFG